MALQHGRDRTPREGAWPSPRPTGDVPSSPGLCRRFYGLNLDKHEYNTLT